MQGMKDESRVSGSLASRLNWLRAGVLGANDGVVSVAGLVVGVAAATSDVPTIATAGVAGLVAGAVSMAMGEYVSVSTQRDTERALIARSQRAFAANPEEERNQLVAVFLERGVSQETARVFAEELDDRDLLRTRLSLERGIDLNEVANPWVAAGSSAIAFAVGAALPLAAILLSAAEYRIPTTFASVLVALAITGWFSASLGEAARGAAVVRLVCGGAIAMAVTFAAGQILGTAVV